MFSDKKYVFETSETRFFRKAKGLLLTVISIFIAYSITCIILLLVSKQENQATKEKFFKTSPDIIVVFTGHTGRIPYAIKLAKKYRQSNILISGVHTKNNLDRILKDIKLSSHINPNFLDIDYSAKNTFENVSRTLDFIRAKEGIENILVVSHDYHILRIKAILKDMKRDRENYNFYFTGVDSNLGKLRDIKTIYKEVFKFFRTIAYLTLGDID